MAIQGIN